MDNILQGIANDGQLDIRCNVAVRVINGDTGEEDTRYFHNRVTKTALMGIIRYIYGDFDKDEATVHQVASSYTPKYLALGGYYAGEQTPSWSTYTPSVGTNITELDHELNNGDDHRVLISSRQITNNLTDNFITISFRTYISSEDFKNTVIKEAGLFIGDDGNNCWSKITITPELTKGTHDFLDVLWDVKVSSIGATSTEV